LFCQQSKANNLTQTCHLASQVGIGLLEYFNGPTPFRIRLGTAVRFDGAKRRKEIASQ